LSWWSRLRARLRVRERREHLRVYTEQLRIVIDGAQYMTRDWSLGGFRIADRGGAYKAGDVLAGQVRYGRRGSGEFVGEVVNADDDGIGVRFSEITPSLFVAMGGLGER